MAISTKSHEVFLVDLVNMEETLIEEYSAPETSTVVEFKYIGPVYQRISFMAMVRREICTDGIYGGWYRREGAKKSLLGNRN